MVNTNRFPMIVVRSELCSVIQDVYFMRLKTRSDIHGSEPLLYDRMHFISFGTMCIVELFLFDTRFVYVIYLIIFIPQRNA